MVLGWPIARNANLENNRYMSIVNMTKLAVLLLIVGVMSPLSAQDGGAAKPSVPVAIKAPAAKEEVKPAAEPSDFDLQIDGVLDEGSSTQLRERNAHALLKDPKAHQMIIDKILLSQGNITAKTIICRVVAADNGGIIDFDNEMQLSAVFIDSLFTILSSQDPQLSRWAGLALVKCHDGVAKRLADVATDTTKALNYRIAAIGALELIPGKAPVSTMVVLLKDEKEQIRTRVADALAEMLYLPRPLNIEKLGQFITRLSTMDETKFLIAQQERRIAQLQAAKEEIKTANQTIDVLRGKWLAGETEKFNRLKPQDKLALLGGYLQNQQEKWLKVWAMQQILEWSRTAEVKNDAVAKGLIDLLVGFISDANPEIRQLTARSLALLDFEKVRTSAGALLLKQLTAEQDTSTKAVLLRTLAEIEYAEAVGSALELWQSSTGPEVTAAAAMALGKMCEQATDKQMETIIKSLSTNAAKGDKSPDVRRELIWAIRKIAEEVPKYHDQGRNHFNAILEKALSDPEPVIRRHAVYAMTTLYQAKVLVKLLAPANNLLDDDNTTVRSAVIEAVEQFGRGQEYLSLLLNRYKKEDNEAVGKQLYDATGKILDALSLELTYDWVTKLQTTADTKKELLRQAANKLWDKISKAKQPVKIEHESKALTLLAKIAEDDNQPVQAVKWYKELQKLKVADQQKTAYHQKMLSIALAHEKDKPQILATVGPTVGALLESSAEALGQVAQSINKLNPTDEKQLMRQANIAATFISPLKKFPSKPLQQQCRQRLTKIALAVIGRQEKLLTEKKKENEEAIKMLERLDPLLKDYPLKGTIETRKAKLKAFIQILSTVAPTQPKPVAPSAKPQPKAKPEAKPKPEK